MGKITDEALARFSQQVREAIAGMNQRINALPAGASGAEIAAALLAANQAQEQADGLQLGVEQLWARKASVEQLRVAEADIYQLNATKANIDELKAANAEIESLKSDKADIKDLTAIRGEIEVLDAEKATVGALSAVQAEVDRLDADKASVTELQAARADVEALRAQKADVERLEAADAEIEALKAGKASVEELGAVHAEVGSLDALLANLHTILSGSIGAGEIQTIHLTGENLVVDDAVISDAMIGSLSASKLSAGVIYTNLIQIMSQGGNIHLHDNTMTFADNNGVTRIQIGEDAGGDYNLYLWGADGRPLWNAAGITEAGLGTGIVKDAAIAEDANISGSKLNIASVVEKINADGSLTIDASRVILDDTRLDVSYKTLQQTASTAVQQVLVYYAQSESGTEPPETGWSTTAPEWTSGTYMWQKTVTTFGNGRTSESEPTCLSGAAGESAVLLRIDSSCGTVFKHSAVSTTLSAVVYYGAERITDAEHLRRVFGVGAHLEWSWQRMGEDRFGTISAEDARLSNGGFSLTITSADVDTKTVFLCELMN